MYLKFTGTKLICYDNFLLENEWSAVIICNLGDVLLDSRTEIGQTASSWWLHTQNTQKMCVNITCCCHHDQTHKRRAEPNQTTEHIRYHLHLMWVSQIFGYGRGGNNKTSWQSWAYRFGSPVTMLMKTAHGCSDNKAAEVSPTVFILIGFPEYLVCFVAVTAAQLSTEHQATPRMFTIMFPIVFFSQRLSFEWTI